MKENSLYDKKSIRELTCKNPDWNEIAKDCAANAIAYRLKKYFFKLRNCIKRD